MMYLIVSDYHDGLYWGPNGNGYTSDVAGAGLYDYEAAHRIIAKSPGRNRAVDALSVLRAARVRVAADLAALDVMIEQAALEAAP